MKTKQSAVIIGLIAIMVAFGYISDAAADVEYTFVPPQYPDLRDLDHYMYYTWGIDKTFEPDEILEASLTFYNIRDWTVEDNDMLYIHLLDDVASGYNSYVDPEHFVMSDYFDGQGLLLGQWYDPAGGGSIGIDLTIVFNETALATLAEYSQDGNFGFGLDPDCHYFNDGVEFRVLTSEVVPEPSTLALLGFGVGGLSVARYRSRRRKRS